jgi:hypothetical protein
MFTHKSDSSVNKMANLQLGTYLGRAVVYRLGDGAGDFVLTEYSRLGTKIVSFVEILIRVDGQNGIYYADFLKQADGLWRDNNGRKAHSLAELLPPSALSATQVEAIDLDPIEHIGGFE